MNSCFKRETSDKRKEVQCTVSTVSAAAAVKATSGLDGLLLVEEKEKEREACERAKSMLQRAKAGIP